VPLYKVARKFDLLRGAERGVALIEVLVALAILGIVAAAILGGMATASKAAALADERTTVQSLAISQMECVKSSTYIDFSDPGHGDYELIDTPENYSVEVATVPIDPDTGQALPEGQDLGLQKIVVTAGHYGESVLTLESYKGAR